MIKFLEKKIKKNANNVTEDNTETNKIKFLCDECVMILVSFSGSAKKTGLNILNGVKLVLKTLTLDTEGIESSKNSKSL